MLATKPKHSLFQLLIDNLSLYAVKYANRSRDAVLYATGPFFVTEMIRVHNQTPGSDAVTVVPPKYFVPVFDSDVSWLREKCWRNPPDPSTKLHKYIICKRLADTKFNNSITEEAFLEHRWVHTYKERFQKLQYSDVYFNIYDVFPKSRLLSTMICN